MNELGKEYHKIQGPYKRYTEGKLRNQLCEGEWTNPVFEILADVAWIWTEKLDGTNIRVIWDGHKPEFKGRTDRAILPKDLLTHLESTFTEELLEQTFGETAVTLYGEGVGPGIQKNGAKYGDSKHFVLFDVRIGYFWLERDLESPEEDSIDKIAKSLGIPAVPIYFGGSPLAMIDMIEDHGRLFSQYTYNNNDDSEGVVGTPVGGLLDRSGRRIIMKVKLCDFAPKESN